MTQLVGRSAGEGSFRVTVTDEEGGVLDSEEHYYEGGYTMEFEFDGQALVVTQW